MYISIRTTLISLNTLQFISQIRKIYSKSSNLLDKLKVVLDSARSQSNSDRFNDNTSLHLLKVQSISLIREINSQLNLDVDTRSILGKVSLALLHCYSNNGYLDIDFTELLLSNIYLNGCSPRAMLTLLESLQKGNLYNKIIYNIFNKFMGNHKLLISLPPQDLSQLLWRFIAINEFSPFFPIDKYYYTIGTLIMHCRKRIQKCLKNRHENKIAWSTIGGNRGLDDFLMAIKLYSHSMYCKGTNNIIYGDNIINNNLCKLHLSQLIAINELLNLITKNQHCITNTSDTAKKVINSLQELIQSDEFNNKFNKNCKIYYETPIKDTRYTTDIIIYTL